MVDSHHLYSVYIGTAVMICNKNVIIEVEKRVWIWAKSTTFICFSYINKPVKSVNLSRKLLLHQIKIALQIRENICLQYKF